MLGRMIHAWRRDRLGDPPGLVACPTRRRGALRAREGSEVTPTTSHPRDGWHGRWSAGEAMATTPTADAASQRLPAALYALAALIGAAGQFYYKRGGRSGIPLYRNLDLLIGIAAFGVVMALFVLAYRLGGRISFVYPFYATTFVWGTLIGVVVDREPWSPVQIGGVLVVLIGVAMVAFGAPS